uniref:Cytidylyltransferase family protein n=1 Tax=Megaviridae environmental sample TaxID=1737588 RepID=A0A5J6VKA2_9VIRU|nr:MAG: hypothetical protein [Megaviridae environmental sample]
MSHQNQNTNTTTLTNPSNIEMNDNNHQETSYTLNFICKHSFILFSIFSVSMFIIFCVLTTLTLIYSYDIDYKFGLNQVIKYVLISIIQYLMALLVEYKNAKVNYTRKVIHISYFIFPQLLDIVFFKYKKNIFTELWNIWIIFFLLILLSKHVRDKISIIDFMFKAVDRPEDRPYTLIWFSSQIIATLIVLAPFTIYFNEVDKIGFVFIPILINGLADGLAEPVGIRFGKHKYKTKACLSNKVYERSYEGSFCVFIVSTIIILSYYGYMNLYQYIFNVLSIPIIVTLTEAFAPHTWDAPLIFLVTSGLLSLSLLI